jgi:hypothetical protein
MGSLLTRKRKFVKVVAKCGLKFKKKKKVARVVNMFSSGKINKNILVFIYYILK